MCKRAYLFLATSVARASRAAPCACQVIFCMWRTTAVICGRSSVFEQTPCSGLPPIFASNATSESCTHLRCKLKWLTAATLRCVCWCSLHVRTGRLDAVPFSEIRTLRPQSQTVSRPGQIDGLCDLCCIYRVLHSVDPATSSLHHARFQ